MSSYRWNGGTAQYSNASSWTPNGPPLSDDSATIDIAGVFVTINAAPNFIVGNNAAGTLLVANTANLQGSVGTQVFVGSHPGANGTLSIASGGTLVDQAGSGGDIIGFTLGATGSVSVDGAKSLWSTNGRIFVGLNGSGTLTVSNGGSVSATGLGSASNLAVYAGASPGSSGLITVTGPGSSLSANGRIGAGTSGTGTLDVLNGATVSVLAAPAASYSSVFAGGDVGTTGAILVSGVGSRLDAGGGEIGVAVSSASTGAPASGILTVIAGGTVVGGTASPLVQAGLLVGFQGNVSSIPSIVASGIVTLDGTGTLLSVLGNAGIGRSGSGVLAISNGASAALGQNPGTTDGGLFFGTSAGSIGQGTLSTNANLSVSGNIVIGSQGTANVLVQSGAQLSSLLSSFDKTANQGGIVVSNAAGTSSLTLKDAGSRISTNGDLTIGRGGTGTFSVSNGATASTTVTFNIGRNGTDVVHGNGSVTIDGSGSMVTVVNLAAGGDAAGTLSAGLADLKVTNGARLLVAAVASLAGGATVTLDALSAIEIGGTTNASAGVLVIDALGTLSGDGSVSGRVSNAGLIDATHGLLRFSGGVSGAGNSAVEAGGTLELAGATGNSGNISFNGAGTLRLDTPSGFSGVISALSAGGTIDVVGDAGATAQVVGNKLHVSGANGTYDFTLSGNYSGVPIHTQADSSNGTNVIIACYAAGTRILTIDGDKSVESLQIGDSVVSFFGGSVKIEWIGHRHVDCRRHPRPNEVCPVRVVAGAFGAGRPERDLLLSPDHAVYVGNSLIPIRCLLNGSTIVREEVGAVTYYHVQLPSHDVILAEGLAAESYLDCGNRDAFSNGDKTIMLYANFAQEIWESEACARQITHGPILAGVIASLAEQAEVLGSSGCNYVQPVESRRSK